MSTGTLTPYRSGQAPGHDDFARLLRAEWTKFRTVRGWVIAMIAGVTLTALAVVALAAGTNGAQKPAANPIVAIGPGGVAVTDSFHFARQTMHGNGSITVRVTSLADTEQPGQPPFGVTQPWAKAGIMIKASTAAGSAYAAVMATPGHGIRMQYDYTYDTAGLPGAVSAASPRWLRLTRAGDTITGYDSTDGSHRAKIGTATLAGLSFTVQAGLSFTVQAGLFAASPQDVLGNQSFANNTPTIIDTRITATVDHITLTGTRPGGAWTIGQIGFPTGSKNGTGVTGGTHCTASGPQQPGHYHGTCTPGSVAAGSFATSGSTVTMTAHGGDIAPFLANVDPLGTVLKGTAIGLIARGLIYAYHFSRHSYSAIRSQRSDVSSLAAWLPSDGFRSIFGFCLLDGGLLAYRLRKSWVMPATTAVASTHPKTIMSQV